MAWILESNRIPTEVDNSVSSTGHSPNSYACSNTNDKVFLLSYEEATTYYANNTERTAQGTDYAKCQGLQVCNGNGDWWLRSPHYKYAYTHYVVNYDGDIDFYRINRTFLGVRPACWINL